MLTWGDAGCWHGDDSPKRIFIPLITGQVPCRLACVPCHYCHPVQRSGHAEGSLSEFIGRETQPGLLSRWIALRVIRVSGWSRPSTRSWSGSSCW